MGVNGDLPEEKKRLAKVLGCSDSHLRSLFNDPYKPLSKEWAVLAARHFAVKEEDLFEIITPKKNAKKDSV